MNIPPLGVLAVESGNTHRLEPTEFQGVLDRFTTQEIVGANGHDEHR